MAKVNPRSARISGVIQHVVASALATDLHDPRLERVTVTEVRVTNDMQLARIYWTQLGEEGREEGERKRAAQALNQARGHLRSLVGRSTGLRLTPQLEFIFDQVPFRATTVEDIMAAAHKRDQELAKLREQAHYAGDANPYRHDEDKDEDKDDAEGESAAENEADQVESF
ncbi:MAG: 30S ribosome-binding factor RbfA [Parascardovia denticolens]